MLVVNVVGGGVGDGGGVMIQKVSDNDGSKRR
jgi:hypothetical protein